MGPTLEHSGIKKKALWLQELGRILLSTFKKKSVLEAVCGL